MKQNKMVYFLWAGICILAELVHFIKIRNIFMILIIILTVIIQIAGYFVLKKINGNKIVSSILIFIVMAVPISFLGVGATIATIVPLIYGFSGYLTDEYGEQYIYNRTQSVITIMLSVVVMLINYHIDSKNNIITSNIYTTLMITVGATAQIAIIFRETNKTKEILKNSISNVRKQSNIDALTGLYNRKIMDECIINQINSIHTFSVIIMDIDNFKKVNDTYGHAFGDEVLKGLAQILKTVVRGKDVAFRYGGEEFVIVCPNTSIEDGKNVAERIRIAFNEKEFEFEENKLHFSISLGVSECSYHEYEPVQIIKNSDTALYHSKKNGKNRVTKYNDIKDIVDESEEK